jgi:hypothetical protein
LVFEPTQQNLLHITELLTASLGVVNKTPWPGREKTYRNQLGQELNEEAF